MLDRESDNKIIGTLGATNTNLFQIQGTLSSLARQFSDLNKNLRDSAESSTKLTKAIKNVTLFGVGVAVLSLCWDIYKTLFLHA